MLNDSPILYQCLYSTKSLKFSPPKLIYNIHKHIILKYNIISENTVFYLDENITTIPQLLNTDIRYVYV